MHGGGLTLPSSKIKALVTVPLGDPLTSVTLEEVWVKLIGVPPPLRLAEWLLLSTREVGRPISVDVDSMAHPETPVRMSFGCRKGDMLPDSITLFVNMQGYRIKVLRKNVSSEDSRPQAPPRFPPGDGNEEKEEDCEETDDDRWDGWRGRHLKDKRSTASAPGTGGGRPRKSVPLAASPCSPPACPLPVDAVLSLRIPASACSQYDNGTIKDPKLIQQHVYEFYRTLLGPSTPRVCGLAPSTWEGDARVSEEENVGLAYTFSEAELEAIVKEMKTDTASGPDGFPVAFFKNFSPQRRQGSDLDGTFKIVDSSSSNAMDRGKQIETGLVDFVPHPPSRLDAYAYLEEPMEMTFGRFRFRVEKE
ncbi:hypothetical protein QYE76_024883 [Lolium multiflorum]|uniref:DUF4283 domain-containing protein n=1 Tax=Lolium multiflorum TaxID=4521 RepID=A0AAD8REJ6_LOLMU|nr:hypothetical protein QYE76_024883 [Lolium multiflorum]